jgi:hypothetical protein
MQNNSKGSTLDPDMVAQEHHSFFFPDNGHGAANAAGFGWPASAGRLRLAQRRLKSLCVF